MEKNYKKMLPYGMYSTKQKYISNTIIYVVTLLLVIGDILVSVFDLFNIIIAIVISIVIFFLTAILCGLFLNQLNKALKRFYNDLDYQALEKEFNYFLSCNLHPDAESEILSYQANVLSLIDLDKANNIFMSIKKPKTGIGPLIYDMVDISININLGNEELSKIKLNEFKTKYSDLKYSTFINELENFYIAIFTLDTIENVENLTLPKHNFGIINKYSLLMEYYNKRNDSIKAVEYANKILEMNTNLNEVNKRAKEIIN